MLDLTRRTERNGKQTSARIGFLVAKERTLMPLVFVFENFDIMRARVQRCDR